MPYSKIYLLEWYQLVWTEPWSFSPLLIFYYLCCFGRITTVFISLKFHYDTVAWTLVNIFILGTSCYLVYSTTSCKMASSLIKIIIFFNDRLSLLLHQDNYSFLIVFHLLPQLDLGFPRSQVSRKMREKQSVIYLRMCISFFYFHLSMYYHQLPVYRKHMVFMLWIGPYICAFKFTLVLHIYICICVGQALH